MAIVHVDVIVYVAKVAGSVVCPHSVNVIHDIEQIRSGVVNTGVGDELVQVDLSVTALKIADR